MKKNLDVRVVKYTQKKIKNVSQNIRKKGLKKKIYYIKINPRKCLYMFTKFFYLKSIKKNICRVSLFNRKGDISTVREIFTWIRILLTKPKVPLLFMNNKSGFMNLGYLVYTLSVLFFQRLFIWFNTMVKLKNKFLRVTWTIPLKLTLGITYIRNFGRLKIRYGSALKLTKKKFIFLKLKKLVLEQKLYHALSKTVFVSLKRICNQINPKFLLVTPKTSRMWWVSYLFYFKDFINILYFSAYFSNSRLLTSFIGRNILNKKNHYRFLRSIKRIINYFFWFERAPGFYGICIKVHGKFHGILRKRKFHLRLGRTRLHTLRTKVDCSYEQSFTRFGVFSIKTWLLYTK